MASGISRRHRAEVYFHSPALERYERRIETESFGNTAADTLPERHVTSGFVPADDVFAAFGEAGRVAFFLAFAIGKKRKE
jgi:hypothetical protein